MKNRDMPAMPTNIDHQTLSTIIDSNRVGDYARFQSGLTKREHFAGLALQGIIASGNLPFPADKYEVAEHALEYADLTLEALEKDNEL